MDINCNVIPYVDLFITIESDLLMPVYLNNKTATLIQRSRDKCLLQMYSYNEKKHIFVEMLV